MKKLLKVIALVVFVFGAVNVNAQVKKLGHIDSDSLLKIMPGRDSALAKLEAEAKVYENQLAALNAEFQKKYSDYETLLTLSSLTDVVKQDKQNELQNLQTRIENFQKTAQDALQKKQAELLQPIIDKAKKAITDVAKESGYTYIFDSALGVLLYTDGGDDIMPLVKKKLGIK